jgi:hypothetical protein
MRKANQFRIDLSEIGGGSTKQLRYFALLNLGMVQSLASGVMSATEAVQLFYNAENCLYVREHFQNKKANAIMSHGVQLPDLFEVLSTEEASREFLHELETIRSLCMSLLATKRPTRVTNRVAVEVDKHLQIALTLGKN